MYADDTRISFSSHSIPGINKYLNSDLLCLKTWMVSNKLSLNVTKTQTLLIGGRIKLMDIENSETQKLQIFIGKEPVSKIKHTKYLGIEVDQHLNWEEHISAIRKRYQKESEFYTMEKIFSSNYDSGDNTTSSPSGVPWETFRYLLTRLWMD